MFTDSFNVAMTVVIDVLLFVRRSNDLCLGFADLFNYFNVCATVVNGRPEYPSEGCYIQVFF